MILFLKAKAESQLCSGRRDCQYCQAQFATGWMVGRDKTGDGFIPRWRSALRCQPQLPGSCTENVPAAISPHRTIMRCWPMPVLRMRLPIGPSKQYSSITGGYFTSDPSAGGWADRCGQRPVGLPYTVGVKGGGGCPQNGPLRIGCAGACGQL